MDRLLQSPAVQSALRLLDGALQATHPLEALYCRYSAKAARWAFSVNEMKRGRVMAAWDEAFKKHGALRAMALVKLSLQFVDSPKPIERLQSLVWLREAMSENPANVLGIHRLLVSEVLPICRGVSGLLREVAVSVLDRWVPGLVARYAHPEALPLIDLLLDYGVGVPRKLALRFECLLGLGQRSEAERAMERLRAIADVNGHLLKPVQRGVNQHVDDIRGQALLTNAKMFNLIAEGGLSFPERRLKQESPPPDFSSSEASSICRAYASEALTIFRARSKEPPLDPENRTNYTFYIDWATKLIGKRVAG
jgi:hypothetical protein